MFGIRGEVTHGREAKSRNHGILNCIDVFVNLAGLKAAIEMDVPVAGNRFSINRVRELPL